MKRKSNPALLIVVIVAIIVGVLAFGAHEQTQINHGYDKTCVGTGRC